MWLIKGRSLDEMDRSLAIFLRTLQTASDHRDASSLFPTATSLLVSLYNPLNLRLITSQLLSAPALWESTHDLGLCRGIFSVFYTAALQLSQPSASNIHFANKSTSPLEPGVWATAVVKGADEKSPRWRHLLVLGAIHLAFHAKERQSSSPHLRSKIELSLVTVANLALQEDGGEALVGKYATAFVLNHTFELLSDFNRAQLNYDRLLPILVQAAFTSKEALQEGYWLSIIDRDVVEVADRKFNWSIKSPTYALIQEMQQRPLMTSLGPMSRLIAHAVLNVHDQNLLLLMLDRIADFARTLSISWRQNKLSEIDASEEADFLDEESLNSTLPKVWHILRLSLFASIVALRAVIGRALADPILASAPKAPHLATQCLYTLRNLYFVASRLGQESSSQYMFVSMAAIDMLSQYPEQAELFVQAIKPVEQGLIPAHPADRSLDLFFFNTAEHLTPALLYRINEEVVLASALPYLTSGGNKYLVEIFEAAHSTALSVLAVPQNADIASRYIPFYLDTLFKCFPDSLSARQFRLAFKTIIRISSPPSRLSLTQPLLPSILLETILDRAKSATQHVLPNVIRRSHPNFQAENLSEQAALILAMIDSLCFLRPNLLEEWLPLTASAVSAINDLEMRSLCQENFWDVLSGGAMDVERAALCVTWWNSRGGREQLFCGNKAPPTRYEMSGALSMDSKL